MVTALHVATLFAGLSLVAAPCGAQLRDAVRNPAIRASSQLSATADTSLRASRVLVAPSRVAPQAVSTVSATSPQVAATKSISRTRLQQMLGGSDASIRVVRASGVSDLPPSASAATIAPGEFVFRKMSDTARRITTPSTGSPVGSQRPVVQPNVLPRPAPPRVSPDSGPIVTAPRPDVPTSAPRPNDPSGVLPLPASVQGAEVFAMPYRWLTVDSAGVERLLMPYFVMLGGGLTYDPASRLYRGVALIGVEDTLHQETHAVTLARPLRMQLSATNGGKVVPAQLAISHTSFDYDSVRIESPDSTHVRIRTGADPAGIVIPISVVRLVAALTPQQTTLAGFGLTTTDIAISLPRGMARSDTVNVTLSSSGAPVRPATIDVTGRQGATVRLRSGRLGDNTIRAFIDGVQVGETVVASEFPLGFLIATLVGIVIGGAARFVGAKRRKRVRSLPWDIAKGSPVGLLAAIGGAVGLDMLHLKLDDPAAFPAIIVTAALGAWFGTKLLDSTSPSRAVAGA